MYCGLAHAFATFVLQKKKAKTLPYIWTIFKMADPYSNNI